MFHRDWSICPRNNKVSWLYSKEKDCKFIILKASDFFDLVPTCNFIFTRNFKRINFPPKNSENCMKQNQVSMEFYRVSKINNKFWNQLFTGSPEPPTI